MNKASRYLTLFLLFGVCGFVIAGSSEDDSKPKKAVPVFKDGEAQIVDGFKDPDFWIRHDLWVETEFDSDNDGKLDRVHVSVTRPRQTETEGLKLPVIYVSSPYFAGTGDSGREFFWDPHQEVGGDPPKRKIQPPVKRKGMRPIISKSHQKQWVPRGYIVVHSSSPGTGLSQGCPTVGGDNESLAPKAVIDWLCGRADGFTTVDGFERVASGWCTGKVGMTGTSYNGTIPLAAATTGVDGLEAIIPIAPNTSYYHYYYRSNGLVRHPGGYVGEDIDCLYEFIHSGPEASREGCDVSVRDEEMQVHQDRKTGDYNDFWAGRDYLNDMEPMKCALLMAHAFNDWNVVPEHSVRIYEAAKKKGLPCQVFFHQGGHGGPPPMKMMNRWFTRYLHGVENEVEKDKRSWIVREKDDRDKPTAYDEYPHPEAKHVALFLEPGAPKHGTLSTNSPSSKKETLIDNYSFNGEALARAEWTRHRLMYVSAELKQSLHISGTPKMEVRLASDKEAANLSVWLVSLPWNSKRGAKITDNIITRGWADPQNYRSMTESEPLKPGKFYTVKFDLQPDDQVIPAGQQIGLMIFSSDQDFTLWPEPGTELTIDLAKTKLQLPIVGGKEGWDKGFVEPEKKKDKEAKKNKGDKKE